jgi:adenylate cyclase
VAVAEEEDTVARRPGKAWWTRPLRVHLSLVMVALLVAVAATLIGLDFRRGRAAALLDAEEEMRVFSGRLVERYGILFADTIAVANLAAVSDIFAKPPPDSLASKTEFLRTAIATSPHIGGAYLGYPDGSFVQVVNLADDPRWGYMLDIPEGAATASRVLTAGSDGVRRSQWSFNDDDGNKIATNPPVADKYDPRPRPWYVGGIGKRTPIYTAYRMATSNALGMTIGEAHAADPRIVIGVDILLDTIARFMADEKVSPGAVAFVVGPHGRPVVHSDPVMMARIVGAASAPDRESKTADPLLEAARAANLPDGAAGQVTVDGRSFVLLASNMTSLPLLKGYTIVVAAPTDELTAEAERGLLHGIGVSALILAAGILCALVFARLISGSLQTLTAGARRMQELDFDTPIAVRSRIAEIATLATAMSAASATIRTFGLYVPKELVRRIIGAGQFTGRSAHRQEVTALFTDIYDFTTISEQHPPEDVVALLSSYFDIFSEVIAAHNGAIIQFLGDSVFAMWNAPTADPRHAENACRCALALSERIDAFNASLKERGLPQLRTRFGIHTGSAVVGSVGASERLQYTGMGDTVNVASRLEGMNKAFGTTILVSSAVAARCPPDLVFRPLGKGQAKGRAEELEVCELVGVGAAAAA